MPQTTQNKVGTWSLNGSLWGQTLTAYSHGDVFTLNDPNIPSNTIIEKGFSGGLTGIVESRSVGATIPNGNGWLFTTSANNPVVYNDTTRGKVMMNDFAPPNTLDASKTFTFSTPVPENTDFYSARWVRAEVLTTGSVPYPDTELLQWKLSRDNYTQGISDDGDVNGDTNTGQELFAAIFYNGNGRQVRIENNDGLATGTITSGSTTSVVNDTSQNWVVNSLKNRRIDIKKTSDNTHQYGVVASNTATSFTIVTAISVAPSIGDTYIIATQQDYFGLSGLVPKPNSGWFMQERFINAGSLDQPNGTYTIRYRQNGVVVDDVKTGICIYGGTKRFIYPYHQDYFGNNTVAMTSKKVYSDDIFAINGSNKRVVLSNSINLNTATTYELQDWTTWSSGTLSGIINTGGITVSGQYYLCVVTGLSTILSATPVNINVG